MFKKVLLSFTFVSTAMAQIEIMNNPYPVDPQGYKFYPDSDVTFASRVTNAQGQGMPGVPYKATIKQYAGWGYHTHETEHGTFISRHDPVFFTAQTGLSDANGYLNTDIELNGYAGAYTFCHILTDPTFTQNFSSKCV